MRISGKNEVPEARIAKKKPGCKKCEATNQKQHCKWVTCNQEV